MTAVASYHPRIQTLRDHVVTLEAPFLPLAHKNIIQRLVHAVSNAFKSFIALQARPKMPQVSYKVTLQKGQKYAVTPGLKVLFAFDGGGVRGKVILAMLKKIEELINERIVNVADTMAGVSTGGIIAAALSVPSKDDPTKPMYTAEAVDNLYNTLATDIFARSIFSKMRSAWGAIGNKYASPGAVIQKVVGDLKYSAMIAKKLVITSLDLLTGSSVYFTNKNSKIPSEILLNKKIVAHDISKEASIVDVLEATSAAPTYFPTKVFKDYNLADGGVADNNPAQIATLEAMNDEAKNCPLLVISLGTGKTKFEPIVNKNSLSWGILQWISPLIDYFMLSKEKEADQEMNLLAEANPLIDYVRIQVILENDEEAQLDNANPENMKRLEELADKAFAHFLANGGYERVIVPLKQKVEWIRAAVAKK